MKNAEREREISRILHSMRIDPVSILQLSVALSAEDIKKQYRRLSLLVHPDRCPDSLKADAQRAFTMLNNCKKDLEDKDFVVKLKHQINEARRRIVEQQLLLKGHQFVDSAPPATRQRTDAAQDASQATAPVLQEAKGDEENDEPTEEEIKGQLREILIDCAWQKRIEDQASQKLEQQTLLRREELKAMIKAEKQYKKEWEEGRNDRVSSWRDFSKKKKKKKRKKKKKSV